MDDYKVQFGIPFRCGLTTPDNRAASSKRMQTMYVEGKIGAPTKVEFHERIRGLPRRARAHFLFDEDVQKLIQTRDGKPLWTRWHYEAFIRRMQMKIRRERR